MEIVCSTFVHIEYSYCSLQDTNAEVWHGSHSIDCAIDNLIIGNFPFGVCLAPLDLKVFLHPCNYLVIEMWGNNWKVGDSPHSLTHIIVDMYSIQLSISSINVISSKLDMAPTFSTWLSCTAHMWQPIDSPILPTHLCRPSTPASSQLHTEHDSEWSTRNNPFHMTNSSYSMFFNSASSL